MFEAARSTKVKIKYQFPIDYYEENLVFKSDKSCLAGYKLDGFIYDFLSNAEKKRKLSTLMRLLWNLKYDTHIKLVPVVTSIRERQDELKKRATGPLKMQAIADAEFVANDLIQTIGDEGNDYETYLIIKLQKPKSFIRDAKELIVSLVKDPVRVINNYAGADDPEIFLNEVEVYKSIEERLYNTINSFVRAQRTDEYQTQRLIRQPFYRGIGEPPIRRDKPDYINSRNSDNAMVWKPFGEIVTKNGQKALRPHRRDILSLAEADIQVKRRHIEVDQIYNGYEVTSYQSFMVISDIPDLDFPGSEWIYNLQASTKFPVDVSIRFHSVENQKAIGQVKEEKKKIKDQDEHTRESAEVPLNLLESKEEADILEFDLQKGKYPLLATTIVVSVAAKNLETLKLRQDDVRRYFEGYGIQVEIPSGDQWDLFNEMLLGGEQYAFDYLQRLSPLALANSMFGATKKLGDDSGFYFAITGILKQPVRIDPWRASQVNKAPNIEFIGSQGGGKSFTADLIACISCKLGAKGVWIDPKGDRTLWPEHLQSFNGQVKVTTFTAKEKDKGKLDPFNIFKAGATGETYVEAMKEAANLALDIGMFLLAADRKDQRTRYLLQAVNRMVNKPKQCMNRVIEELKLMSAEADEEGDPLKANVTKEMADTLNSYRQMAYASLLFGDGDEDPVNLDNSVNVLQIQNLTFPSEGAKPEEFTYQEIIGYASLLAISGFIMRFIMSDRSTLGIFVLDEASVINATPVGKNLVNKIQRMARAMNKPGFFISQNVDDCGDEKVKNNIGYKFAFRSTDETEIRKVLAFYNLEPTRDNIEVISNLENGMCLFQDLEGRTGVIAIDYVFDEYQIAFDTKPKNQSNNEDDE